MVPIQHETLIKIGILVCIVATIFVFRELNEVKDQLNHVTAMNQRLARHANQINQAMTAAASQEDEEEEEVPVVIAATKENPSN